MGTKPPQRKTILSVNRCTHGEIGTIKDMKYILILSWNGNNTYIEVVNIFAEYENF
jgi:hypothetical protein